MLLLCVFRNKVTRKTMPVYCCIKSCHNNSILNPTCSFFELPKNEKRRKKWLEFAGYDLTHDKRIRICIDHFEKQFVWKRYPRPLLTHDAVPTIKVVPLVKKENKSNDQTTLPHKTRVTDVPRTNAKEKLCKSFKAAVSKAQKEDKEVIYARSPFRKVYSNRAALSQKRKVRIKSPSITRKY